MLTPAMRRRPREGQIWAADTGCFARPEAHDDAKYLAWLERMNKAGGGECLFATAPDRWGDAKATLELSIPMLPRIRELGIRAALVAQDGLTAADVPWDLVDCLFVGGSEPFRKSLALLELVDEAKARGIWTHAGRINSGRRFRWADAVGFDSVDGTFLAFGERENRPRLDAWLAAHAANPSLWRR